MSGYNPAETVPSGCVSIDIRKRRRDEMEEYSFSHVSMNGPVNVSRNGGRRQISPRR